MADRRDAERLFAESARAFGPLFDDASWVTGETHYITSGVRSMMFDWKLISSDSHIVELPDPWAERLDRSFRARGPRVLSEPDGDWWMIDGTRGNSFQGGAQVGKRFEHADELRPAARFSEVRPGAYQPAEFLRENEEDGIWASVIYPTGGLQLFRVPALPDDSRAHSGRRASRGEAADHGRQRRPPLPVRAVTGRSRRRRHDR